jgi:hypothetical protein
VGGERRQRDDVLRLEPKRDAARGEHLDAGGAVEQVPHVRRRSGQVLQVVEEDERAGLGERLSQALGERPARRLPDAHRARDRRRHQLGIRDRRQTDEMDGPEHRSRAGDLEG